MCFNKLFTKLILVLTQIQKLWVPHIKNSNRLWYYFIIMVVYPPPTPIFHMEDLLTWCPCISVRSVCSRWWTKIFIKKLYKFLLKGRSVLDPNLTFGEWGWQRKLTTSQVLSLSPCNCHLNEWLLGHLHLVIIKKNKVKQKDMTLHIIL